MKKKVLIVVANPSIHPTLNYPVGFWASELFHPITVFQKEGISYDIVSPEGGKVILDPMSDPNDESGYSAWDQVSKQFIDEGFMTTLESTTSISDINEADYDAIMVAGGQSPMFTFEDATQLHKTFETFYNQGKVASALCHGVSVLNYVKDSEGNDLATGKTVTGFTNEEEDAANAAVGTEVMPWRIEDALLAKNANFKKAEAWHPFAVADGNLVTGQQNMSGEVTAQKIVELLNA
ncbi:type 1 glutamine amidotransferase domain-containing protein [Aureisphaera galaxeae]|uniref:type 1 glutamine amidotransferase domain-containing protein n=1 Tax=Aureisphaera galaxeae TaxID=1538023 RepID=UPI0023507655|nr:type 1 glutamine amidotransferase domain-containing protein [Aureisphaera galaxeae]MDC8004066.1 type 1 glutamine amidotransferase domain-containing protein [Aureisphaera galaxeae]